MAAASEPAASSNLNLQAEADDTSGGQLLESSDELVHEDEVGKLSVDLELALDESADQFAAGHLCTDANCSFWRRAALISANLSATPLLCELEPAACCAYLEPCACAPSAASSPTALRPVSPGAGRLGSVSAPKLQFARRNSSSASSLSPSSLANMTAIIQQRQQQRDTRAPAGNFEALRGEQVGVARSPSASSLQAGARIARSLAGSRKSSIVTFARLDQQLQQQQAGARISPSASCCWAWQAPERPAAVDELESPGEARARRKAKRRQPQHQRSTSDNQLRRGRRAEAQLAGGVAISVTDTNARSSRWRRSSSDGSSSAAESSLSSAGASACSLAAGPPSRAASVACQVGVAGEADAQAARAALPDEWRPKRHHSVNERPKQLYVTPAFILQQQQQQKHNQLQNHHQSHLSSGSPTGSSSAGRRLGSHSPSRFNFGR